MELKEVLESFDSVDIYKFKIILNRAVSNGITDVRLIQQQLLDYLTSREKRHRKDHIRVMDRKQRISVRKEQVEVRKSTKETIVGPPPELIRNCPSCGKESVIQSIPDTRQEDYGGDKYIFRCACGWSRTFPEFPKDGEI